MPDYEQSYLGQLRAVVGNRKMFTITARAIIVDNQHRVLFVQRRDNRRWVMPAGSMELEESILDTCKREVKEETGLIVEEAVLMAIYSDPRYSFITAYGDPYQLVSFVFRVDKWSGIVNPTTDETLDARFFALNELPEISPMYQETLDDLKNFRGTVIVR